MAMPWKRFLKFLPNLCVNDLWIFPQPFGNLSLQSNRYYFLSIHLQANANPKTPKPQNPMSKSHIFKRLWLTYKLSSNLISCLHLPETTFASFFVTRNFLLIILDTHDSLLYVQVIDNFVSSSSETLLSKFVIFFTVILGILVDSHCSLKVVIVLDKK